MPCQANENRASASVVVFWLVKEFLDVFGDGLIVSWFRHGFQARSSFPRGYIEEQYSITTEPEMMGDVHDSAKS